MAIPSLSAIPSESGINRARTRHQLSAIGRRKNRAREVPEGQESGGIAGCGKRRKRQKRAILDDSGVKVRAPYRLGRRSEKDGFLQKDQNRHFC